MSNISTVINGFERGKNYLDVEEGELVLKEKRLRRDEGAKVEWNNDSFNRVNNLMLKLLEGREAQQVFSGVDEEHLVDLAFSIREHNEEEHAVDRKVENAMWKCLLGNPDLIPLFDGVPRDQWKEFRTYVTQAMDKLNQGEAKPFIDEILKTTNGNDRVIHLKYALPLIDNSFNGLVRKLIYNYVSQLPKNKSFLI